MNLPLELVDLLVFVAYLALVVALGFWVGKGSKDLSSYLLGGRDLPWWGILGSIVATETSTVTFLSVPGWTFAEGGNMTFMQLTIGYIIGRFLVTIVLLPGYFQGKVFSAYELLEQRFGKATQQVASVIFLIARNFGDALRLFLTALVLQAMFDLSLGVSIVVIGILTIAYTLVGGMKAVIWNDCLQLIVYLAGGVMILLVITGRMPNGFESVVDFGKETGRFQLFDLAFDYTKANTLWAGLVGGVFLTLGTHGVDQMLVQRYLSAKSQRDASAALIASGFIVALQFAFFMFLGIALAAFYQHFAEAGQAVVKMETDRILPHFIVNELPAGTGLIGFVLAGVFAAAMSTLSSSLNSSAAVVVTDLLPQEDQTAASSLRWSQILTACFGIVQMIIAYLASFTTESVIGEVLGIAGMTVGLLLGLFALSKLNPHCGEIGAIAGLVFSACLLLVIKLLLPIFDIKVAWPWFALIGSSSTVIVASIFNSIVPSKSHA